MTRRKRGQKRSTRTSPRIPTAKSTSPKTIARTESVASSSSTASNVTATSASPATPEFDTKSLRSNWLTTNPNEIPVSCSRGRRNRSTRIHYIDHISSTEEEEEEENYTSIVASSRSDSREMPVLQPEVDVPSSSIALDRPRRGVKRISSDECLSKPIPISEYYPEIESVEVELKELQICLVRVDDLEEFRSALQKFKEKLQPNVITDFAFDFGDESEDQDGSQGSEDESEHSFLSNKKPFECTECDSVFAAEYDLEEHVEDVHAAAAGPQKPIKCNYCSRFFTDRKVLEAHESQHSTKNKLVIGAALDDIKHTCQFCQKTFKQKMGLKKHIELLHSFPRPSVVDHLDKSTFKLRKQIAVAKKHIRPPPPRKDAAKTVQQLHFEEPEPVLVLPPIQPEPIYVSKNGAIELGPVIKQELGDEVVVPFQCPIPSPVPEPELHPIIMKVNQTEEEDSEEETYPMADIFPADSPPVLSDTVIPLDITNGVQLNVSDMGSLLDMLDGPDPNAGVPGQEQETLTLNYERNNAERGRFKCEFCPKVLSTKVHMLAHRRESHSARIRKPYICLHPNCSQRFESSQQLQIHRNKAHARKEDVAEVPFVPIIKDMEPPPTPSITIEAADVPFTAANDVEMIMAETEIQFTPISMPESQLNPPQAEGSQVTTATVAERNEDLLKGLKFMCKVCGAKFKTMPAFVQHEWNHSEGGLHKDRRRGTVTDLTDEAPGPKKRFSTTVKPAVKPKAVVAAIGDSVASPQCLTEDIMEIPPVPPAPLAATMPPLVKKRKARTLSVQKRFRETQRTSVSLGSPVSVSNSSEDSNPVPQNGVSFRVVRDDDGSNNGGKSESKICDICAHVCVGTFGLENHIFQRHKMILCISCNLCSTSQEAHELHLLSAHKDHVRFCRVCIKLLHNDDQFARHTDSEPHRLKVQQVEAAAEAEAEAEENELNLACEVECHHRKHCCELCTSAQHTLPKLELHVLQAHQQYLCILCQKLYASKQGLDAHRRGHVGESPYDCELCMMPFRKKSALTAHQRSRGHVNRVRERHEATAVAVVLPMPIVSNPKPLEVSLFPESIQIGQKTKPVSDDDGPMRIHQHLRNPKTGDYQCCLCLDAFLEYDVFDSHMVYGHELKHFKKISARVRALFSLLNQKPQLFKCVACKKIFLSRPDFSRHWVHYHHDYSDSEDVIQELNEPLNGPSSSLPKVVDFEDAFVAVAESNGSSLVRDRLNEMLDAPQVEASQNNLPLSIIAPIKTKSVFVCGKCDNFFVNQVELNIHAVNCARMKANVTPAQLQKQKKVAAIKALAKVVEIIDLTEDDDDEMSTDCTRGQGDHTQLRIGANDQSVVDNQGQLVISNVISLNTVQLPSESPLINKATTVLTLNGPERFEMDSDGIITNEADYQLQEL